MSRRLAVTLAVTAAIAVAGLAQALDRRIRITNATGATMVSLQASGVEVLGSPIPPGGGSLVTVNDDAGACIFDFVAQFDDGSSRSAPGVDVCNLSVYAIE